MHPSCDFASLYLALLCNYYLITNRESRCLLLLFSCIYLVYSNFVCFLCQQETKERFDLSEKWEKEKKNLTEEHKKTMNKLKQEMESEKNKLQKELDQMVSFILSPVEQPS